MGELKPRGRSVRTIHLNDEQINKLLDKMDAAEGTPPPERKSQRYKYRAKAMSLHMQQPGSSITVPYIVPTRDISEGGVSFLHGGFVHRGTRCLAQLITTYGTLDDVWGTVVNCRYLEGNIHEVSVRFDQPIDPSAYCSAAMHSRVLLAEDDPTTARLATFYLDQLNAQVEHVDNGKDAVEKAMQNTYDMILMDIEMPVMNGFEAAGELRRRGYTGRIVAATALTQPDDRRRCLEAGCDKYIAKPFTREDLKTLLLSLREEPLISSFHKDPSMAEIVDAFVRELPVKVRDLEQALIENDVKHLQAVVRLLKGEGSGYGFDVISRTAAKIESAILAGSSLEDVRKDVAALKKLCMQARSSRTAGQKST